LLIRLPAFSFFSFFSFFSAGHFPGNVSAAHGDGHDTPGGRSGEGVILQGVQLVAALRRTLSRADDEALRQRLRTWAQGSEAFVQVDLYAALARRPP
jgi:hypothetical protein